MDAYDKNGTPIDLSTEAGMRHFGRLHADWDYRCIRQTDVGSINVSTVWIGTNMNFFDVGPPLIFETMVFDEEISGMSGVDDDEVPLTRRYATEDEARQGHAEIVGHLSRLLDAETTIEKINQEGST